MSRGSTIAWRIASFAFAAGLVLLWQLIANAQLVSPTARCCVRRSTP